MNHKTPKKRPSGLDTRGRIRAVRKDKNALSGLKTLGTDLYHHLLSTTWPRFFFWILLAYTSLNLFFATLFFMCDPASIDGMRTASSVDRFQDSFFFSVQTLATIGYGRINPHGVIPNLLVTFEALIGLLSVAVMTGLFFARFSKPTARILFSQNLIHSEMDGEPCLYFRMANERMNQLVEAKVTFTILRTEFTKEGLRFRNFQELTLERHNSPLFALSWTVVHPIDAKSPLFGLKVEDMVAQDIEFLVSVMGIDDTYSQTVYARNAYRVDDILWNVRFEDMVSRDTAGRIEIDLSKIHQTTASLP